MNDVPGNFGYYSADFRKQSRLASLYSDFRSQKTSNPDGFAANCQAWLQVLTSAANDLCLPGSREGQPDRYVIHHSRRLLAATQSSRYGQPLALDAAIHYGIEQSRLIPLQDFLKAQTSIYSKSKIPSAWQMISWGLKKIGMSGGPSLPLDLVAVENLEASSEAISKAGHNSLTSSAACIFDKTIFLHTFDGVFASTKSFSATDFDVLMTYMSRDQQKIAYDADSGTIKFSVNAQGKPEPITQEDKDIASLRALILTLSQQVSHLEKRVQDFDDTVRKAITAKNQVAAKNALRSKKLAESTLQQRTATLGQLEEVFGKIEQAADQVEIVRVMEAAGRTLRTLNERTGGVEKIQDVMEELREQALNTDEITQALNEDTHHVIDEAEVDDELAELEKAQRTEVEQAQRAAQALKDAQLEQDAEEIRQRLATLESPSKAAFDQEHKADEGTKEPVTAAATANNAVPEIR